MMSLDLGLGEYKIYFITNLQNYFMDIVMNILKILKNPLKEGVLLAMTGLPTVNFKINLEFRHGSRYPLA
ncbi:hypothetical protein AD941_02385 [Gluconobacter albidus]|uniref:Uncharacterized protein n=1 Tax=Gluconobacter albidus TaxID=318683 RepID=A0AAW3R082_9PROT|nr:hypothetical protein AD941_02385 [Gluconobacter albidus]